MDFESIFAQTRWQILSILSVRPLSPLEIAKQINATISHVSQQLKFLEAIGLVKKEKVTNRDKGKPRMLFSLAGDYAHISLLVKDFSAKKLISLTEHQKVVLRIWFFEQTRFHVALQKLYWEIEPSLSEIQGIFIDNLGDVIVLVDEPEKAKTKLGTILKQYSKDGLTCSLMNEKNFLKNHDIGRFYLIFRKANTIQYTKEVLK